MAEKKAKKLELQQIDGSIEIPKLTAADLAKKYAKKYGAQLASEMEDIERIPTNILSLDYRLKGGFARGRIVFLAGAESSWKSTICLKTIASVQKLGGKAAYIDAEATFDRAWAELHGVDVTEMLRVPTDTAEKAYNAMRDLVLDGYDVVVLDSLNALAPKKEMYSDDKGLEVADIEVEAMGVAQKKTSQWLRANNGRISKARTLFLVIGQLRDNLNAGMFGNPETVVGGKAIKHYSSYIVMMRRMLGKSNEIRDDQDEIVGRKYAFKLNKNKLGEDGKEGEFTVYTPNMVDNYSSMLEIGKKEGFILMPNNKTYEINGIKYNGKLKAMEALADESTGAYAFCEKELRHIMGTKIYEYNPYKKQKEKEEAAAVVVPPEEDENGNFINPEEGEE